MVVVLLCPEIGMFVEEELTVLGLTRLLIG